jgi:hypothetical protein
MAFIRSRKPSLLVGERCFSYTRHLGHLTELDESSLRLLYAVFQLKRFLLID